MILVYRWSQSSVGLNATGELSIVYCWFLCVFALGSVCGVIVKGMAIVSDIDLFLVGYD